MKKIILFILISFGYSHVGNPSIIYEGNAGEYPIRVVIRPPGVVPGLALIYVQSLDEKVTIIKTQPIKWDSGIEGSPPPDIAKQMFDQPEKFNSELWLMDFGSYGINIEVDGEYGIANVVVPVMSIATKRSDMDFLTKSILIILMLLLLFGFVTIIGASIEEATLHEGKQPNNFQRREAKLFMVVTFFVCIGIIFIGKKWWNGISDIYYSNLFQPMKTTTQLKSFENNLILNLEITDPMWKSGGYPPIVPDHGKLIHTYIIKEDLSVFSHVHPILNKQSSDKFELVLSKNLPTGKYLIYSDITHETGYNQTLLDTFNISNSENIDIDYLPKVDPDDSIKQTASGSEFIHSKFEFEDGSHIVWEEYQPQINSGFLGMNFTLLGENLKPLVLEPYIEMGGHGIIYKKDGTQFIHIHPTGNFSMASQEVLFELKEGIELNSQELFCTFGYRKEDNKLVENQINDGRVTFPPFELIEEGEYRIWVQIKNNGHVKTGIFDFLVIDPDAKI